MGVLVWREWSAAAAIAGEISCRTKVAIPATEAARHFRETNCVDTISLTSFEGSGSLEGLCFTGVKAGLRLCEKFSGGFSFITHHRALFDRHCHPPYILSS